MLGKEKKEHGEEGGNETREENTGLKLSCPVQVP